MYANEEVPHSQQSNSVKAMQTANPIQGVQTHAHAQTWLSDTSRGSLALPSETVLCGAMQTVWMILLNRPPSAWGGGDWCVDAEKI